MLGPEAVEHNKAALDQLDVGHLRKVKYLEVGVDCEVFLLGVDCQFERPKLDEGGSLNILGSAVPDVLLVVESVANLE